MKIGETEINQTWIVAHKAWLVIGSAILIGVLLLVIFSIPSCQKPVVTPQQTINEMKTALEKVYDARIAEKDIANKEKDATIKKKEDENSILRVNVASSIAREKAWSKKYNDLKEAYSHVALPTTDKEMRDRYTAAGFPPAPSGVCGAGYICFSTGYK